MYTAVLGRPLPTSLRRRLSAASQVRQSTTPGSSATPVANVRAFSVAGPSAWNSLPDNLRDSSVSRDSFCKLLKSYLFTRYWNIESIRGFTRMRYTNLLTYLLTYNWDFETEFATSDGNITLKVTGQCLCHQIPFNLHSYRAHCRGASNAVKTFTQTHTHIHSSRWTCGFFHMNLWLAGFPLDSPVFIHLV